MAENEMVERVARALWHMRWHSTRVLVALAFAIAPRGPARDVLIEGLNAASRHIYAALHPKGEEQ